ncbi:PRTRC system protein E [Mucilaginibacter gossypiicola]|uniref:PRTRC system protein E n=1 Tax=Mucilaginibacter gossypiicola TaxID=551995 RepID=A0A1H8LS21_9SPHI|nr:hypothetical protein [Mucilaginibacter gossypiicola]SEO07901.1 PRTRC system protein E [Mucilaginibacter gossypiicola]
MKTDFFSHIAGMECPGQWSITIHTDAKGNFTVSTLFKLDACGDTAQKHILPFTATGRAQDFDEGYFAAIEKPVKETAGLLHNMEDYMKSLSKAKEQSKMVQDNKTKSKNKPEGGKEGVAASDAAGEEAKRKAYTEAIRKVVDLDALCKYDEALEMMPTAEEYPDREAEIAKRKAELERRKQQKANLLF